LDPAAGLCLRPGGNGSKQHSQHEKRDKDVEVLILVTGGRKATEEEKRENKEEQGTR
jgi:hypothetical protein